MSNRERERKKDPSFLKAPKAKAKALKREKSKEEEDRFLTVLYEQATLRRDDADD